MNTVNVIIYQSDQVPIHFLPKRVFGNEFAYCYHLVYVIKFSRSHSDHIRWRPLYSSHPVNGRGTLSFETTTT